MISVNLQPDGTGYVFIPGRGREISAGTVAAARERAARILSEHAASTGKTFEATVMDVGETFVLTVHADGRIVVNSTVAQGRYRTEHGYQPVPRVPDIPADAPDVREPLARPDTAPVFESAPTATTTGPASHPLPAPVFHPAAFEADDDLDHTRVTRRGRRRGRAAQLQFSTGDPIVIRHAALIGRQPTARDDLPDAQLVAIDDTTRSVSKTHCLVTWDGDTLTITDLGSTNGTDIDRGGEPIAVDPDTTAQIGDGDTILIGDNWFTVSIPEEPGTTGE